MGATPRWKVYDPGGEYRAAFKFLEDAACLVALLGDGTTIRDGHSKRSILWVEGKEDQPAAESYDFVQATCQERADRLLGRETRTRYDMTDAATATGMYDHDDGG